MIISLTGFMGCGKSCIGRILSEKLGYRLIDLDAWIEKSDGRSVRRIFSEDGEAGFRKMETATLKSVVEEAGDENIVLSLGGGTLTTPEAAGIVHSMTACIYLKAGIGTLVNNLTRWPGDRPMLGDHPDSAALRSRIEELMSQRARTYEHTAHIIMEIDGREYSDVAEDIIRQCVR